jgi:Ti-type conjugative transfer relaxase TraA
MRKIIMAIYHLSAKIISRGKGRNAVAAAAYRRAEKLYDERCEKSWNYQNKPGVVYSEISIPANSPSWLNDINAEALWNLVEKSEKRIDAQLSREIEFSLPVELNQEQGIELARNFIQEQFVSRGMVADWNVHWDNPENPHVHVMLTMRELTESGFGKKIVEWNHKSLLFTWREKWAESANLYLKAHQHNVRIDHRSYKDQGIDLVPTVHRGHASEEIANRGEVAELKNKLDEIKKENLKRILENPELLAKKIFQSVEHHESVFSDRELSKSVLTYANNRAEFDSAIENIKKSKNLIYLGLGEDGRDRYTTQRMFDLENNIQKMADKMQRQNHVKITQHKIQKTLERYQAKIGSRLTDEQRAAVNHVVSKDAISCLVGRAGTGKSFSLGAANAVWKSKGLKVYGIALMGVAASGLNKSAGIESSTIESFRYSVQNGIIKLSKRDVIVMDEAGMTDSVAMEAVLNAVHQSKAKLVLVGDHAQLQPVGPGATFRAILERIGFVEIQTVFRQKEEWQREATKEFSKGFTKIAIEKYEQQGFVHFEKTESDAMQKLVGDWSAKNSLCSLVLAHRNKDVNELNRLLRQKRIDLQEISQGHELHSKNGTINLSLGDKILFLKNNKTLGVKNGHFAAVTHVNFSESGKVLSFTAMLDEDRSREIIVDPDTYHHFTYGYAATVHKSQGATVDNSFIYLGGRGWNKSLAYVAMSRHKENCHVYGDQATHKSIQSLKYNVNRKAHKDSVLDYPLAFSERRGINNESLIQKLPQVITEKLKQIRNKIMSAFVQGLDSNNVLSPLLKRYVDYQVEQQKLVDLIAKTKFSAPEESRMYFEQYKENKAQTDDFIKKVAKHPVLNQNLDAMKNIKSIKLSEVGGFQAIAERMSKNQFEAIDTQALIINIRGKIQEEHYSRTQNLGRGGRKI